MKKKPEVKRIACQQDNQLLDTVYELILMYKEGFGLEWKDVFRDTVTVNVTTNS